MPYRIQNDSIRQVRAALESRPHNRVYIRLSITALVAYFPDSRTGALSFPISPDY
jgi:hypothetical protein